MQEILEAFEKCCHFVNAISEWHYPLPESRKFWESQISGWEDQIAEISFDPEIAARYVESSPRDDARIGYRNSSGTILATLVKFVEHIQKLACSGHQLEAIWSQLENEKIIWFVTESDDVDWWKRRLVETTENRHSPGFAAIVWDGRIYHFTKNQSLVVAELWEAYANGTHEVTQSRILELVEECSTTDKTAIKQIFQRCEAWKKRVIRQGERENTYRLFSENFE